MSAFPNGPWRTASPTHQPPPIDAPKAEPIVAMGRFNHEAVAVDPTTDIVYQTEDREDGLFYRFLPDDR